MNILDKIVANKKEEVAAAKSKVSIKELKYYRHFTAPVASIKENLIKKKDFPVITEFKRQSPSKGIIHAGAKVVEIVPGYAKAGAAGISVLTDVQFFGGSNDDLSQARDLTDTPIIRKEFIIDPYQIYEAKAIGASAVLLIAAILEKQQAADLASLANYLGLEVLMEFHDESEAEMLNSYVDMAGINNRNLKTFEVDLQHAANMISLLPSHILPIAESGIHSADDFLFLKNAGFQGFLMGEYFMKHSDPAKACADLKAEVTGKSVTQL
ncbi:indole-3-glycerol phosphate synthase [Marinilabilia salmonicolor]|jgi:indole-3-glycerol phosphate synthase|uniref:indole-3-glycerol phosphate synthase TrpC n=1 Tax=Marinilabilia salmonicolor TaxID=989 RepID=UPI000D0578ED|nr:indole-3-glycerol phosphate synthase TrpC [Marinilabilia salmonicolor]PRZ02150.1 indole-3-glycerol phosphate synthase [Marinilabilia salmonicolor]